MVRLHALVTHASIADTKVNNLITTNFGWQKLRGDMEGETGFRSVFIERALIICENNKSLLSEWENNFIIDIARVHRKSWKKLTTHQYNTLMEIYNKVKE